MIDILTYTGMLCKVNFLGGGVSMKHLVLLVHCLAGYLLRREGKRTSVISVDSKEVFLALTQDYTSNSSAGVASVDWFLLPVY